MLSTKDVPLAEGGRFVIIRGVNLTRRDIEMFGSFGVVHLGCSHDGHVSSGVKLAGEATTAILELTIVLCERSFYRLEL